MTRPTRCVGSVSTAIYSQVVADTLGLNDSAYQYVIDALEADEIRAEREKRDEEDRQKVGDPPTYCFRFSFSLFDGVLYASSKAFVGASVVKRASRRHEHRHVDLYLDFLCCRLREGTIVESDSRITGRNRVTAR